MLRYKCNSQNAGSRFFQAQCIFLLVFIVYLLPVAGSADSGVDVLQQIGETFAQLAEQALPAVVHIEVDKVLPPAQPKGSNRLLYGSFEHYEHGWHYNFNPYHPEPTVGRSVNRRMVQGCGFIVSQNGYILTNEHVVAGAKQVSVTLADGRGFWAKIVGADTDTDIAVLKINATALSFLELGDSDSLKVGDWIVSLGSPLSRGNPFTSGMVTAKGKKGMGLANYEDFIQTDAAITAGDRGGPLLNLQGKVVGIVTAVAENIRPAQVSYAIAANIANITYQQIVEYGDVKHGYLGVKVQDINREMAEVFGLKEAGGVFVTEVIEDSPAEKAGLKSQDVIVKLNGMPTIKANDFCSRIAFLPPKTRVEIVVLRRGVERAFTISLGKRSSDKPVVNSPPVLQRFGISVHDLTYELVEHLGYGAETGVLVTKVRSGSQAERVGITVGTLILQVNRLPVRNARQLIDEVELAFDRGNVLLLIRDQYQRRFISMRLK